MEALKVDRKRILEIAEDLIRLRSDAPPRYEGEVADYIYSFYEKLGLPVEKQPCGERYNVIARLPGREESPGSGEARCIMYAGHMDTVPPGEEMLWTSPPCSPQIRGGRLYGRGSCDMKGSLACSMYAAEYLVKNKIKPRCSLLFVYDADEERTNIGLKEFLKEKPKTDFIIVGEPTGLELAAGHRGVMAFTVTIRGKSCHAGQPLLGKNAVYGAADAIEGVRSLHRELSKASQEYTGSPSVNVTGISGGQQVNVIPDKAVLRIDRRLIFGENRESCKIQLENVLKKAVEKSGCNFSLEVTTYCPPGKTDVEIAPVKAIRGLLRQYGISDAPKAFEASCEAGMLQEAFHVPTVVWGPGEISQAHQIDEFIELKQLYQGAELLIAFFTKEDCDV